MYLGNVHVCGFRLNSRESQPHLHIEQVCLTVGWI